MNYIACSTSSLSRLSVIPAKAGTQTGQVTRDIDVCTLIDRLGLGPRLRGDDSTEMSGVSCGVC
ncbi:MAG: hypothetical protein EAZ24_07000 [Burkholderiales bacterium]|nr:MAG: hypothetical protein EAZ24_07000 [Burkholderiales bacterium]TAG83075.1 MAG: hypothetical protein EAZ21_02575 [Betaproteobacteria bacterium]